MAIALVVLVGLLALAWLPGAWVKRVLERHGGERVDLADSGAAFARRLLDAQGLGHVRVEASKDGDHYDPADKAVRLSKAHYGKRSLAAQVVAAHEVGHALQDAEGYAPLARRGELARQAAGVQRFGGWLMIAAPVVGLVTRSPLLLGVELLAGAAVLGSAVLLHAFTLPVEHDASFRRALPLLKRGGYLAGADLPAAREILRAAAFTYVASAAMTLLDVTRWLRVVRL